MHRLGTVLSDLEIIKLYRPSSANQFQRVSTLPPDVGFISPVLPHSFYRLPIESDHRLIICSSEVDLHFSYNSLIFTLCPQAVYEIGQVTPLDALRDALQEGGTEGRATFEICQKIGFTEILVLGLGILVSDAPTDDSLKPKVSSFSNCNHYSRRNLYIYHSSYNCVQHF